MGTLAVGNATVASVDVAVDAAVSVINQILSKEGGKRKVTTKNMWDYGGIVMYNCAKN